MPSLTKLGTTLALFFSHMLVSTGAQAADYVRSTDSACAVWAPWSRGDQKQAVRYQGPCVKGKADGKGRAEWINLYRPGEVDETWEGNFRNGVFIGEQSFKGSLDGWSGNVVVSERGELSRAPMVWIHRAANKSRNGTINLCEVQQAGMIVKESFDATDDANIQSTMKDIYRAVASACQSVRDVSTVDVAIWRAPLAPNAQGEPAQPLASGSVVKVTSSNSIDPLEIRAYRNEISANARLQQQESEKENRQTQTRKAFQQFSVRHQVHAWATTNQIYRNPFRWKQESVAVAVKLDRMLTPSVAWVRDAGESYSSPMLIKDAEPDAFGHNGYAIAIGTVSAPQTSASLGASTQQPLEAPVLTIRHMQPCEKNGCAEWFDWEFSKDMKWGEPYRPNP